MKYLDDKVLIVTGAGQGMGEATAKLAAQAGAKVVVAELNEEAGKRVADEIKAAGGEASFVRTDVSKESDVKAMVHHAVDTFGRLDLAVNNAAVAPDSAPIAEADLDKFDQVMAVDMRGVALSLKYEIQQMLEQGDGGSIVNISSAIALKPNAASPGYIAAKHAVIGLTKSAAYDYGKEGIRTNAVAPGSVDTEMLASALESLGLDPVEYAKSTTTVGRFARPEEVAEGTLWLLSDKASYVNGFVLGVEGGYQDS